MTIDDRFGTTRTDTNQPGTTQTDTTTGERSPEYDDGLTVQDTTHGAAPSSLPGGGRVGSASDPLGGYTATAPAARDLGDNRDGAGRDRTNALTADESGTLIAADKVVGTAVYDAAGERLGTIDSIMLNKRSGKVAYAVMSFGGFLGIGERFHPLPWNVLTYDNDKGGYNVEHSADDLRKAPNYSRDEVDTLDYGRSGGEIDNYYGVDVGRASYDDPGAGNTTRPTFAGRGAGVEAADAIGSTTGAGSSGMGSTGMGSNRNF